MMRLTAAASGFIVFLISMSVVQGGDNWKVTYPSTQICTLKGSTVEMSCTYTFPSRINGRDTTVKKILWFTRENDGEPVDLRKDSEYSGRVQYSSDNDDCTLRISDLRESDSAVYYFRFITNHPAGRLTGSPGVTLFVTDPQLSIQVIKAIAHQGNFMAELKCHSWCRLPDKSSFVWYKNGQKTREENSSISGSFDSTDSFSCALHGHEDSPSSAVCFGGNDCYKVTYNDRRICAFKGSSVDISCMYSSIHNPTSEFWFSPERKHQWQHPSQPEDLRKDSQYAGRVEVIETKSGRSTLRISDLTESDSAEYHFKFKTKTFEWKSSLPGTTLTVTDPDLQVQLQGRKWFYLLEKLECHSSCRLPDRSSYIWYENGQKIQRATSSFLRYFDPAHSYSCAVEGFEDFPSPSVCVHGQTCNRVTYTDRSICALKGSSVDISCTYSSHKDLVESNFWFSPDYDHQWKNPSEPEDLMKVYQHAGRVQMLVAESGCSTLRISDLTESDSAEYRFKFKTPNFEWRSSLPGTTLTVTAVQVMVTRKRVYRSYTDAELTCQSRCSPAGRLSYVWFKNGEKIMEEESSSYHNWFYPGDGISCAFRGHENYSSPSVYALMVPSVSVSPSGEILEGSAVNLTCSSDANTSANYTWYKKNQTLISKEPQLVFSSVQSSDTGEYYCAAGNEMGSRTSKHIFINVKYAPRLPSVSVSASEIVEGSSVTLTCSSDANPAANYTWYKENQTLFHGPQGSYHFTSIRSEDSGIYYCKSGNQYGELNSESVFIDVQYAPRLPSVSVSLSEILEGSSVNLTCSSDANPAANYTWYKENEDSPKASGQIFTITDFRAEHSGNYYCEAQNSRGRRNSTLHLIAVARAWRSTAAGTTTAVVLAVVLLSVFILTRKKRAAKQSPEPGERPDYRKQRQPDEQQDELLYASVRFSKNKTDPLCCNIRPTPLHRHKVEETVVYAAVKFKSAPRSQTFAGEDPAALHSTINKTC